MPPLCQAANERPDIAGGTSIPISARAWKKIAFFSENDSARDGVAPKFLQITSRNLENLRMKLNLWGEYYGGIPIKFVVLISLEFI